VILKRAIGYRSLFKSAFNLMAGQPSRRDKAAKPEGNGVQGVVSIAGKRSQFGRILFERFQPRCPAALVDGWWWCMDWRWQRRGGLSIMLGFIKDIGKPIGKRWRGIRCRRARSRTRIRRWRDVGRGADGGGSRPTGKAGAGYTDASPVFRGGDRVAAGAGSARTGTSGVFTAADIRRAM
jgi:hypothetical protein